LKKTCLASAYWALSLLACGPEEPAPVVAIHHESLGPENPADDDRGCHTGSEPTPLLRLTLENGDEPGQVRQLGKQSTLRIVATNESTGPGTLSLGARVISRAGFRDEEVARAELSAGDAVPIAITADELALPSGTLDFSGSLVVTGALTFENGTRTDLIELSLHFHPTEDGWQIYDTTARETLFDGGILTDAARARRAEAQELAAELSTEGNPVRVYAADVVAPGGDVR
jgi:hypothetical protein